jgi:hypothetical protein
VGPDVNGPVGGVVSGMDTMGKFMELFDTCLRACDDLNMGDMMGTFSYVAFPDLIACAQTRSHG